MYKLYGFDKIYSFDVKTLDSVCTDNTIIIKEHSEDVRNM